MLQTSQVHLSCNYLVLSDIDLYLTRLFHIAFLTRSQSSFVGTMQGAVDSGLHICAHPALRKELEIKWPDARFVFSTEGNEFNGGKKYQSNRFTTVLLDFTCSTFHVAAVLDDFDAGKCTVMAIGKEDTLFDAALMERFCERELVFTDSLILETPIAFPIKPELVSGMSYWILEGEKYHGVSIEKSKNKHSPHLSCNVELSQQEDLGDMAQISVLNMVFPIMVFIWCAVIAVIVHVCGKSWSPKTTQDRMSLLDTRKPKSSIKNELNATSNAGIGSKSSCINTAKPNEYCSSEEWEESPAIITGEQHDGLLQLKLEEDVANF